MKSLVLMLVLFLSSCSNAVNVSYEKSLEYKAYAFNEETSEIAEVYVEYVLEDAESIFYLYTIYQNYLPVGYYSAGNSNISLLETKVIGKEIYYYVDNYVLLSDITKFHTLLTKTAQIYDYKNVYLFLNNKALI